MTPHLLIPHLPTHATIQRELAQHRRALKELSAVCVQISAGGIRAIDISLTTIH
jgi:hypothetical protein